MVRRATKTARRRVVAQKDRQSAVWVSRGLLEEEGCGCRRDGFRVEREALGRSVMEILP